MPDPKNSKPNSADFPILPDNKAVKNLDHKILNAGNIPSVFIGSSRESLEVARLVKAYLTPHNFEVDIWDEGVFGKTRSTGNDISNAEWLKNFTDIYDFSIFLFVPDDEIVSQTRKHLAGDDFKKALATRHNVVFEFGLFLGRIGARRSFILFDKATEQFINHFFTDLRENLADTLKVDDTNKFRLELYPYKSNYQENYQSKIKQDITQFDATDLNLQLARIKERMLSVRQKMEIGFLPSTSLAIGYFNNFLKIVIESLDKIGQKELPEELKKKGEKDSGIKEFMDILRNKPRKATFKIVLSDLEDARYDNAKEFLKTSFLVSKTMPGKARGKTVYCKASSLINLEEDFVIYDIPTTVNTSLEAIQMVTPYKDIRELLIAKEKYNFEKVLRHLIDQQNRKQEHNTFEDFIDFITFDQFLQETGQLNP